MAITATVDLGNEVSKASCYIIVPTAYVKKFDDDSFKLIYDVHIYQNESDRDSETRKSKRMKYMVAKICKNYGNYIF